MRSHRASPSALLSALQKLAFSVSLLLLLSSSPSPPLESGLVDDWVEVSVVVRSSEGVKSGQATVSWFLESQLEGQNRIAYRPLVERKLNLGAPSSFLVPRGLAQVLVRAPGHARYLERFQIDGNAEVTLRMLPARPLDVQVLVEDQGALVPFEGATVLVGLEDESPQGKKTDQLGRAAFDELPRGPLRVQIFALGYETYEAVTDTDLVVQLRPASVLRVRVRHQDRAVPNASVFIAGAHLWPTREVQTLDQGFVDISGLRPGTYSLYAAKENLVSQVEAAVEVQAVPGRKDVVLALREGRELAIRVVSSTEQPVPDARVTWSSAGLGPFSIHGVSGEAGDLTLGPFPFEQGFLRVRAAGYVSQSREVNLGDSQLEIPVLFQLEAAGEVAGRVVDERGFPIAGATVEVMGIADGGQPIAVTFQTDPVSDAHFDWALSRENVLLPAGELGVLLGPVPPIPLSRAPRESGVGAHFVSDEKGRFLIKDVPPGKVLVFSRHPDYIDGKSEALVLSSGEQVRAEVILRQGLPVAGRVLDHRDFPVAGARVAVTARGYSRHVSTAEDGSFVVSAAPRDVSLRVARPSDPLRVLSAQTVPEENREKEILIVLPPPRKDATLRVEGQDGEALELAQVKAVSLDENAPLSITRFSQSDGRVVLPESVGLAVRARIEAVGYVPRQIELTLRETQRVVLDRAVNAEGRVLGVRGRVPATGARVSLESSSVRRHAVVSDDGSYRLSHVPRGPATLTASHVEYGKAKMRIVVGESVRGRAVQLPDLLLEPTVTVRGVVVDSQGRKVPGALVAAERIPAYVPSGGVPAILGRADEQGEFSVPVRRTKSFHLYGAQPGKAFGWSEPLAAQSSDELDEVTLLLDHPDEVSPQFLGSVLLSLERRGARLLVYAVSPSSQAARDGVFAEDVLVQVDGTRVQTVDEARELLSGLPGTEVRLVVSRAGSSRPIVTTREAFLR